MTCRTSYIFVLRFVIWELLILEAPSQVHGIVSMAESSALLRASRGANAGRVWWMLTDWLSGWRFISDVKQLRFVQHLTSYLVYLADRNTTRRTAEFRSWNSCAALLASCILFGFLPRCMQCRRGLGMRELSVCLSVCQTRELWQNERKICSDFYTIRNII